MPRQRRIEYLGAIYQVMNRGDRREPIFCDDLDHKLFLTTLAEAGEAVPESVMGASRLTPFSVEARYPSVAREVTGEQYQEAVEIAGAVVRWARDVIEKSEKPNDARS